MRQAYLIQVYLLVYEYLGYYDECSSIEGVSLQIDGKLRLTQKIVEAPSSIALTNRYVRWNTYR